MSTNNNTNTTHWLSQTPKAFLEALNARRASLNDNGDPVVIDKLTIHVFVFHNNCRLHVFANFPKTHEFPGPHDPDSNTTECFLPWYTCDLDVTFSPKDKTYDVSSTTSDYVSKSIFEIAQAQCPSVAPEPHEQLEREPFMLTVTEHGKSKGDQHSGNVHIAVMATSSEHISQLEINTGTQVETPE